jgi:prepilin-type N-terminal cleavage/methylation domain-containing protein
MCKSTKKKIKSQGFTLVELSIVIIIIGLLIAGISAGTSLINQASVNSVITDMQSYQTSYNNFILRYNSVPGDFANAFSYWGATVCSDTNTNCNGNGNSLIEPGAAGADESVKAWKHLALANMISGAGTTVLGATSGGVNKVIGVDVPASKVAGAGFILSGPVTAFDTGAAAASPWNAPVNDNKTNAVFIAKKATGGAISNAALKPLDAFNIDQKIDDGVLSGTTFSGAATGYFRSTNGDDVTDTCIDITNNVENEYISTTAAAACVSGLALN